MGDAVPKLGLAVGAGEDQGDHGAPGCSLPAGEEFDARPQELLAGTCRN